MSHAIVNLTLPLVTAKIESFLSQNALPPEWPSTTQAELHQKLTTYVLSRLPVVYVTVESEAVCAMDNPVSCYSDEQHRHIDQLIQQGLQALLKPTTGVVRDELARAEAIASPSHWFG